MKKFVIISAFTLGICLAGVMLFKTDKIVNHTQLSDIEALSDCEVYKSDGTLIVKCTGKQEVCFSRSTASGTFYCYGTKVYPKD